MKDLEWKILEHLEEHRHSHVKMETLFEVFAGYPQEAILAAVRSLCLRYHPQEMHCWRSYMVDSDFQYDAVSLDVDIRTLR